MPVKSFSKLEISCPLMLLLYVYLLYFIIPLFRFLKIQNRYLTKHSSRFLLLRCILDCILYKTDLEALLIWSGLPVNDNEDDSEKDKESRRSSQRAHEGRPGGTAGFASKTDPEVDDTEDLIESEMSNCVLKHKSVFKCRICPRIVCLSESTLLAHLKSKVTLHEGLQSSSL